MKPVIEVKDVWKIYKMGEFEVQALRGISMEVQKGEYLAIMGPSGSGKSTAMNMVGCLDTPTKGTIKLEGKDISKMSESDLAQIRGKMIGFVFQSFNLIPTLSAMENVMLPMIFQDMPEADRRKRAKELLTLVDLGDRMHHKPTELSGGQQQRVAIARSMATNPQVILADEPTGNLDSTTGKSVMEFFKELNKKGVTIILVTHDETVAKQAKRQVYLKDGTIVKGGRK